MLPSILEMALLQLSWIMVRERPQIYIAGRVSQSIKAYVNIFKDQDFKNVLHRIKYYFYIITYISYMIEGKSLSEVQPEE